MKLDILMAEQGSLEWVNAKLGVVSASNILKALAKKGTEARNTYLMELVGQVATRRFDEINSKSLAHGKENEVAARAAYEFQTGNEIKEVGFIYGKGRRFGVSPDGLMPDLKKGLELKCPITAKVHADFLCNDKVKPEYVAQVQFSLWVTGFESWDFASFNPFFKTNIIGIKTFMPDPAMFERFENELPEFINDLDSALARLELKHGDQWA